MRHHPALKHSDVQVSAAATVLETLRTRRPRVHCVTNTVAQNFTANVLLAAGCAPSMTLSPEEIGDFVAQSDGLLINLGTLDRDRRKAILMAVDGALHHQLPWVLDPVLVDRSPARRDFARALIAKQPCVMRLNHGEFVSLSGIDVAGIDMAGIDVSGEEAKTYARDHRITLGLSGPTDLVTDGTRMATIANGHPLMTTVTAMGCAGSALIAACLAVERDAWLASVTALLIMGISGEQAASKTTGPGSFATAFIDAIYELDDAALIQQARIM